MSYNKFCCWFVNVKTVHQTTPKCCGKDFLFFFTYGNNKFIWNLFNCLKRGTDNSCINFFIEKLAIFIDKMRTAILEDVFLPMFQKLYGSDEVTLMHHKTRYLEAVNKFAELYPDRKAIRIFSAPGRTEIGGNHTDHQHGCVLAAAVNLDAVGVAAFHEDGVIRVKSEGYDAFTVKLRDLSVQKNEMGTTAIIRGIVAKFSEMGVKIGGFDLYCTSDVVSGSGISSSAAFETLIGTMIDTY